MHALPMGSPPSLVHSFGAFGEFLHGTQGDEPYQNDFWVLNLMSLGAGTVEFRGKTHRFESGWAVLAPPDTYHTYRYDRPTLINYAHFQLAAGTVEAAFPVVQDLGARFEGLRQGLLTCRALVSAEPERVMARLWNLLWDLSCPPQAGSSPRHHPAIRRLMEFLEAHVAEPLDPDWTALQCGCSVTHLNRLCHSAFGLPLAAHVRRLRLGKAVHLLLHTVTPIAAIAAKVGLPDLQQFNKLVRGYTGRSPRQLRRESGTAALARS